MRCVISLYGNKRYSERNSDAPYENSFTDITFIQIHEYQTTATETKLVVRHVMQPGGLFDCTQTQTGEMYNSVTCMPL